MRVSGARCARRIGAWLRERAHREGGEDGVGQRRLLVLGSRARRCSGRWQTERRPSNAMPARARTSWFNACVNALERSLLIYLAMTTSSLHWSQWVCRHEWLHHRTPSTWQLKCTRCGAMTPGFVLSKRQRPSELAHASPGDGVINDRRGSRSRTAPNSAAA